MAVSTAVVLGRYGRLGRTVLQAKRLRLPWIPIVILTTLMVSAIFAPLLAPYDPTEISLMDARIAPFKTFTHPLGTDMLGRDILSRLIFGARNSATISLSALAVGVTLGTTLGLISGYAGKWVDTIIMRITDGLLGFPSILVAMIIVTLMGSGIQNIVVAVAATTWPRFARMVRGEALSAKERDYVIIARIMGVPPHVIVRRHIFSSVANIVMVIASIMVAQVILLEASLSFLGLGFPPGAPAWGIMVAEGRQVILTAWWLALLPGLVIMAVVMAFNYLGDWLRDTLDPKLRRL
ncbi:MAG: ABC transporter permease [Dehalococcoidia bacterium]|nr:ABC transporter permease [Dehalococcoidia bacterium]